MSASPRISVEGRAAALPPLRPGNGLAFPVFSKSVKFGAYCTIYFHLCIDNPETIEYNEFVVIG